LCNLPVSAKADKKTGENRNTAYTEEKHLWAGNTELQSPVAAYMASMFIE